MKSFFGVGSVALAGMFFLASFVEAKPGGSYSGGSSGSGARSRGVGSPGGSPANSNFKGPKLGGTNHSSGYKGSSSSGKSAQGVVQSFTPRVNNPPKVDLKSTMPIIQSNHSQSPSNHSTVPLHNHGSHNKVPFGYDPSKLSRATGTSSSRLPGLNANDLKTSHLHSGEKFNLKHAATSAPKSLTGQPHFDWWLIVLNHHHCHHQGRWNYQEYSWNQWRPCHYTTIVYQQRSYFVGLTCVYIPDMQAYGVQGIAPNSPAETAGLKSGDLIVSINAQPITDERVLELGMPRGRLDLKLIRDGEVDVVSTTVTPRLLQTIVK